MTRLPVLATIAVVAVAAASTSAAGEIGSGMTRAGSYFCTTNVGGGVVYSGATKRWSGSALSGEQQFVFKLTLTGEIDITKQFDTFKSRMGEYAAVMTYAGTETSETCEFRGTTKIPISDDGGTLQCHTLYGDYRVNLDTLRIAQVAGIYDYLNGADEEGATPGISIGTCTKIE